LFIAGALTDRSFVRSFVRSFDRDMGMSHSSEGIGRTGVLILMETALCLMEAHQAIDPLEIVQKMREQRLGMIQTTVSDVLQVDLRLYCRSVVVESISICL
jgi:protein tyrosine phosphatase